MAGTKGHSGGARAGSGRRYQTARLRSGSARAIVNGQEVWCALDVDPATGHLTIRLPEDVLRIEQDAPRK